MMSTFIRKTRQLIDDPVLRRWLLHAASCCGHRTPRTEPHQPPYLRDLIPETGLGPLNISRSQEFRALPAGQPREPIELVLPGEAVRVDPGEALSLFDRPFSDTETLLAVYRFAWLPLTQGKVDPAWISELWTTFATRFPEPDSSWAWHPYTAAERAINLLDYGASHGLPGDLLATIAFLRQHAAAILQRLEYFGDHNTSNHLSNNGRGLYRIGLALGLPRVADIGGRILLAEAERIFLPSGILREGSTHYHLLLTRNYADAFLAARTHRRQEEDALREITRRAFASLTRLVLPGGLPLVGDISPDCPPSFLACLLPGGGADGWLALRSPEERAELDYLRRATPDDELLAADGWLRVSCDPWSALWHVAPGGWSPMPGHAHQDMGSFEAHWGEMPLFVDPGRGHYKSAGEADFYVSAKAHNGLSIDGRDPYPPNKPYYDPEFRRKICGSPPRTMRREDGVSIAFDGFSRMRGVGKVERHFRFDKDALTINDTIEGTGKHVVVRRLHTPWPVVTSGGAVTIRSPCGDFRIVADAELSVVEGRRWIKYGGPTSASVIEATSEIQLPAQLKLLVEPV